MLTLGVRWLRSDSWGDQAATLVTRAWVSSPCAMGIAATTLIAVGQLEPTQSQRLPMSETVLKATVLREINKRMKTPFSGTSDVVINTLMLLASFDVSLRCFQGLYEDALTLNRC